MDCCTYVRISTVIAFLLFSLTVFSQEYTFTRFTQEDGLPGNWVNCFLKDRDGFIWIGTRKGLCRYDGHTFKHYTRKAGFKISDDYINELYQDTDGFIWIGTNTGGVNVYDPVMDSITTYRHEKNKPNTIPGDRVSSIGEDHKGHIWVGFNNNIGLSKINKKTGKIINYDPFESIARAGVKSIRGIISNPDRSDTLWLGTTSGLIAFDTKNEHFQLIDHPLEKINRHGLFNTYRLNENQIAGAFFHAGVDIYNIDEAKWSGATSPLDDPVRVFGITPKSDSELWLAARRKGLAIFDLDNYRITRVPSNLKDYQSPFPGFTTCVYADGKNLWVGGEHGVSFYDSEQIRFPFDSISFQNKEFGKVIGTSGKYDKIYLVGLFGKGLWELDKIDRSQLKIIDLPSSKKNNIYDIVETKNHVVLNDENQKIIIVNKASSEQNTVDLAEKIEGRYSLKNLVFWKDNLVLLITWLNGVHVLDLENLEVSPLFDAGINPPNYHHALVSSDETIWFSNDEDIVIYHPDGDSVSHYSPSVIPGKKNKRILSTAEATDGTKWIGSLNGLIRISEGKEMLINSFNSNLNTDYVRKVRIDNNGYVWLETDEGISKIDPSNLRVTNYGASEGLKPAGTFELIDDKLLVGQQGGYSLFHPDSISPIPFDPIIHFSSFQVFKQHFSLEKHIDHTEQINLEYDQNHITFEFTAPSFSKSQGIYFSYQLEGLDRDWIDAKNRRIANYTNLDGGDYTFQVRARNKDGDWTSPRRISIHIAKPFWETWWFYTICSLAIVGVGFVFYKTRINRLQRKADLEAQELRVDALQKRLSDLNALPPDLDLDFEILNEKLTTPLSEREFEVLLLSLNGKSNSEIGETLFISQSTVKFHLRNTYGKLGVSNRKEALVYVVKKS